MTNKLSSLVFSILLCAASTSLAQSAGGTLRGTVLDPSGALIPHAEVTVSSTTGFTRTLQSDALGAFQLPRLAPGSYSVGIQAAGFTSALQGGIQVVSDKVTRKDIKLGISVAQEIEVSAGDDTASANIR